MDLDSKITQKQAADLLGLGMARISELCAQNWIARDAKGKVTPRAVFNGYIASIKKARNNADVELKSVRVEDYKQRMEARAGKFKKQAFAEAYEFFMEVWPPVVAFIDGLPAMFSRDQDVRKRMYAAINDFKTKIVARVAELKE
jgi:hypothetical protein